jgi:hypothetical protein
MGFYDLTDGPHKELDNIRLEGDSFDRVVAIPF